MRRPEIDYARIAADFPPEAPIKEQAAEYVEIALKYQGYIEKQSRLIEQFRKLENRLLPADLDYQDIRGLSNEARQKLEHMKPLSIGQAGRITGVSPADINVLLIYLEQMRRSKHNKE